MKYCSIGSGSSGNCHYVGYKNTNILIDAGLSGKKIIEGLQDIDVDAKNLNGILITHEHVDHIKGVGILSRKFNLPIFANYNTWMSIRDKIGKVDENNIIIFENDKSYSINDIAIKPFSITHDAVDPVGYSMINERGEKLSIATDTGQITDTIRENVLDSKLVVLESNYDKEMLLMGSYTYALKKRVMSNIGHLSNEDASKFAVELINKGTEKILLAHLSRENNFPALAYETSNHILSENGIKIGKDVEIDILRRDTLSKIHEVGK
ncbi:MBL fold metallo-hydrolase [Peptostreptococcus porci]|uniref:MBL fold metallo-hydrolase n=1 Tax=Peptostreptococcus porci TaxID=2652282 RepID=UPI0023F4927A|nr:MBL fold metallo-hydrolase [Peptostreptococcus porci]MDD7182589.1 MBL fold metallo-hydrolase [Peptostreptococcus porci]MDY5435671.1 MBL fold metallo-hydrolase [Peptostreptococcus porci]MDY5964873.1 MBL fold metallo-hydrolase [Peptostreptococcus porci]